MISASAERRRGFAPASVTIKVALCWLIVSLIAVLGSFHNIAALHYSDPDDSLRMLQVTDWLRGQSWFDLHQYRIEPGAAPHSGGVLMHWSRLVDLPIALVIAVTKPFLGMVGAMRAASVIVPLFTLGIAMALTARIAWRVMGEQVAVVTCLLWSLAFPAMAQLGPLRIDHHGWQIVAVLAAINALFARDQRVGGALIGAAMAFGMAISLELLPFTALFGGVLALRWLRDRGARGALVAMLQSTAVTSGLLFVLTHGIADLVSHCDTLSPAYIAGLGIAGLGSALAARLGPLPRTALILALGCVAGAAGAAFLLIAPECTRGPFAQLEPLVRDYWYANVTEGLPITHQGLAQGIQTMLPPLFGLWAAIRLHRSAQDWLRQFWFEYALLLGGALLITAAVARFGGVAGAIATVPLGWQVRVWMRQIATSEAQRKGARVKTAAAIVLALIPGALLLPLAHAAAQVGNTHAAARAKDIDFLGNRKIALPTESVDACGMPGSLRALAALPRATLFAPLDIGPSILLGTQHSVVATGHHRANLAMNDIIAAFLTAPEATGPNAARAIIARRGARYVVTCDDLVELHNYAYDARRSLAADLLRRRPPSWLRAVPLGAGAGTLRVWEVVG